MPTGTKAGGQALVGGLDCTVHRNFFGAQIRSFSTKLKAPVCMKDFGPELEDFRAVFIRLVLLLLHACMIYNLLLQSVPAICKHVTYCVTYCSN